jgi:hypothetical protein
MELTQDSPDRFYFSEEEREQGRSTAERLLQLRDWSGNFMVDQFSFPLGAEHVTSVSPTQGLPHPGLDFTIGTADHPAVAKVRVTFLEHERD